MYSVYVHTNKTNQKKYVGITSCDVSVRWKKGYGYSDRLPIGMAIRKYGWDGFTHNVVATDLSEDDAKQMECELISQLKTQDRRFGYNITSGGDGVCGWSPSQETRKKISLSAQSRSGDRNPNFGHKWSDEMKKNASFRKRKENLSEDTIRKMSEAAAKRVGKDNPFYGKHHSEHTKSILARSRFRAVQSFDKTGKLIAEYESINGASKSTGIHKVAISNCCRGVTKTSGGYMWRYKN